MANILLWLLWCSSAALSSLASADLLLLDRQKKWINDRAIDFWDWLDDQRELKYLPYLRKFRWQRFVIILYATIALIMALLVGYGIYTGGFHDTGDAEPSKLTIPPYFEHQLLGSYVGSFLAALFMVRTVLPRVLNWVTKTEGSWAYLGRSTLVLVATVAATLAAMQAETLLLPMDYRIAEPVSAQDVQDVFTYLASFSSPITAFISGFCGMLIITLIFVILISWVLVVLPVIFILVLMILFRVVQFVTVRVAENPKGPVYALSVLLAAIGVVVGRFT